MINRIKSGFFNFIGKIGHFTGKRPFLSFIIILVIIIASIVGGSYLNTPETIEIKPQTMAREVEVFSIGTAPSVRLTAEVEKSGIVRIVSQSSGIVQAVNVKEGQEVKKGTNLIGISANYQGGTAESVQKQISYSDYKYKRENLDEEKEIIDLKRKQVEENFENNETLLEINEESAKRTKSQLDLNDEILDDVNDKITELENSNVGGVNDDSIRQLKQTKLQLVSSNNQLQTSIAQVEKEDKDQIEITRELTLKQLNLEEKSKKLALETSRFNLALSQIRESQMYPVTPIYGVVERVFVKSGQAINPGDPIAVITGNINTATAIIKVPTNLARKISLVDESTIYIDNFEINLFPEYISKEPTEGSLHTITYNIPDEFSNLFINESYVEVEIKIGEADTISTFPFVPVDAIYQTQNSAYVYVVRNSPDKAIASIRSIDLGTVYGSFVEVKSGLDNNDQIIMNRNVVENEEVKIKL